MNNLINDKFHIVISGGGFKTFYSIGFNKFFTKKIKKNIINIRCSSAGVFTGIAIACNNLNINYNNVYYMIKEKMNNNMNLIDAAYIVNNKVLPDDIHKLCNKINLEIVVSEITYYGLKKTILKNFESKEHLLLCASAACCIPFITYNKYPYSIKINNKYYMDSGFIGIINPLINNSKYKQFNINLMNINYNFFNCYYPNDKNIQQLINNGTNDYNNFLNNYYNSSCIKIYKPYYNYNFLNSIIYILIFIPKIFIKFIVSKFTKY